MPLPSALERNEANLELYRARARNYARQSKSPNTLRAYDSDWRDFARFCQQEGRGSLPATPETVAFYLTWLIDTQQRKTATLTRRLSAISQAHQAAGYTPPTQDIAVRAVMAGIRRTHGVQATSKTALLPQALERLLAHLPAGTLLGLRDRALLLTGFAGGFRRSELVALRVEDLETVPGGLLVRIRKSKTDPDGAGQTIGIPHGRRAATCPVRALRAWTEAANIRAGFLFRATAPWTGQVLERGLESRRVATIIQNLAAQAGLDPKQFGGHSLRSGLATAAAGGGAPERAIMAQTRHKSLKQVRRYIQRGSALTDNAATYTGI